MIPFSFLNKPTSSFTPASLPAILAWIDASNSGSVTLVGSKVSQINDLSGNSDNATQGTDANRPVYVTGFQNSLNVMQWANTAVITYTNNLPANSKMTFATLLKTGSDLAETQQFFRNDTNLFYFDSSGDVQLDLQSVTGDPAAKSSPLSTNTWYRVVCIWDSTLADPNKLKIYVNNVNVTIVQNNGSGNWTTGIPFIGNSIPNNNGFKGYIAEQLFCGTAISAMDQLHLDNYWTTKWAV